MQRFRPLAQVSRTDVLVAVALFAWAVTETILRSGPGTQWQRVAIAFFVILPLVWRRHAPLPALIASLLVLVPWGLAAPSEEEAAWPFAALLLHDFSNALYVVRTRLAVLGLVLPYATLLALMGSGFYTSADQAAGEFLVGGFFCIGAWTAGRLLRHRVLQVEAERAAGGERARDAVFEERARVARELHDVVGHSVGIIAMQAGAAEALVEKDPAAAREHMATVRRTAQDAMREMRRLVEVLREDGVDFEPQPTLGQVEQLVDDARLAGVPASLEVEGDRRDLPPAIDLAAYRVVQEGLTNVRKHAGPVTTKVRLVYAPNAVYVEVRNAAGAGAVNGSAGGGQGLPGMRERVRIFGGEVEAGAVPGGGYVLRARLPVEEEARA
jgi:signal transduction histidine kinase